MLVYRLMCEEEFNKVSPEFPVQWKGKTKWFTDSPIFLKRVSDGEFNNSKFVPERYKYIVVYKVTSNVVPEEGLKQRVFQRVSKNELMLFRSKQPIAKFEIVEKGLASEWFKKKMTIAIPGDAKKFARGAFHSADSLLFSINEAFYYRASRDKLQEILTRIDTVKNNLDMLDKIILDTLKESSS